MVVRTASVVVIGGGQAGLSAAHHLARRGFTSAVTDPSAERTFVVLDAAVRAGGAWLHRWESLRMATVNGIFALPGAPTPPFDPEEPSRTAVPRYFAAYEAAADLPILRPVRVHAVRRADADPAGRLVVETDSDQWLASTIINATGTWDAPRLPDIPGRELFTGTQLHTREYVSLDAFAGQQVAIVGGGISALQLLEEISRVATTFWYTRREPVFVDGPFDGTGVESRVAADASAGVRSRSVVSYTGLAWTPYALEARRRGALVRRPLFTTLTADAAIEADGTRTPLDSILWATGFEPAIAHLDPLDLRGPLGGVPLEGTRARREPRVHLIGYGPSQSTVGANRAGRIAVLEVLADLAARN